MQACGCWGVPDQRAAALRQQLFFLKEQCNTAAAQEVACRQDLDRKVEQRDALLASVEEYQTEVRRCRAAESPVLCTKLGSEFSSVSLLLTVLLV